MIDGGVGISAAASLATNFVGPSTFLARHDGVYDKESEKCVKLAGRLDRIPKEDIDHFEFEEYNLRHSRSLQKLQDYRAAQGNYKQKKWYKNPLEKWDERTKVRKAKREVQGSIAQEQAHIEALETYSRHSSRASSVGSVWGGIESGLSLNPSRPYRTDSCSIRASGGSPPSASMEDICTDEKRAYVVSQVSDWLSSAPFSAPSEGLTQVRLPNDHNNFDSTAPKSRRVPQDPARKYVCVECGNRYSKQSTLRNHYLTHTGARPFSCQYPGCNRRFSMAFNMQRHMRTHTSAGAFK
ncbi:hypothetical protein M422DRAFT_254944 [Sphaerobolus stellatus SS14]|uniref:C2H2-type domain-containing protein n=1 Tax=Sphaerobolus stellatus (strain SS14) TaxID=990650 RepID=A0A0C9VUK0_SPHS4|nr:hypothetical protein M422DRAFT_254944 [Sphaerobolus stellatus SS14]